MRESELVADLEELSAQIGLKKTGRQREQDSHVSSLVLVSVITS